jgi:CRISPR subtype II RNA-guided endonuclease Cas9/Csn1
MVVVNSKKILGLDIGSNSIGFSLLELNEESTQIVFNELTSNSIVFSEPNTAEDRRKARGARRLHRRKSTRNKNVRKIFVDYGIADKMFITDTTGYIEAFKLDDSDVYRLRKKAVSGVALSKEEFVLATYSVLTDRGYTNMFALVEEETEANKEKKKEDEKLNGLIQKNRDEYKANSYELPSMVLTSHRKELEQKYQNIPIRNKKGDYRNSLDRQMHKEEFKEVVKSQSTNKEIFKSVKDCEAFISKIVEDKYNAFYQRPLKSFENMVEYCSFYDEYNPKGKEKRMPLSNIANVELTLRQNMDNYNVIDKNGHIRAAEKIEKDTAIDFWLTTPDVDKITNKNIYKRAGIKDIKIYIKDDKELLILNIQAYRSMLEVLNHHKIDFKNMQNEFYNEVLLELYYYKNHSSRVEHIDKIIKKYNINVKSSFVEDIARLAHMDGFGSFSLKFANEVLVLMNEKDKIHSEALDLLGYNSKYLDMPRYDYLPPLEPSKADIAWLQKNISHFDTKHLFYQPMMSPKVKRVIAILRKLINELIAKYGKIDEIRIETAREMNSKKEADNISKNQTAHNKKNKDAEKFVKANSINESYKNIERAKLFDEQSCECLYCGKNLTIDEAFDETRVEIEHFIPRSVIWINSQKNKILVHKKCNQNKGSQNPISYLKSIGEWENFKGRIKLHPKNPKYKWLTDEEVINSAMAKENWQDSYLNDTRSATRSIAKYLNHYLYPNTNAYNKGGENHIVSVSGKAISELKYMWGIHTVMPKNDEDKKDRNTNYHHTLDAFTIALCSPSATQALHSHFKKNENKFKTKALKVKLSSNIPMSSEGVNVVEHLKVLVEKYETNALYVCPYNKRKTNMKGFKDGNLKLYIAKDPKDENKEILAEMEKVAIDTSLLVKNVGGFPKPRSDEEVRKEIASIQSRLNPIKQQNIIDAIAIYIDKILKLRSQINSVDKDIETQKKKMKSKEHKEFNDVIKLEMKPFQEESKFLSKQFQSLQCSFAIKNNKRQIVRTLKLHKVKISKTSADSILFSRRNTQSIERLSTANFQNALDNKEPFVIKENESTLCVELYAHPKQNQVVGLKYFSSIANPYIKTKFNEKYGNIFDDVEPTLTLYKNDIIKVVNIKGNTTNHFLFNGGGNIAGTNNKISIKNINLNNFTTIDKKENVKKSKESAITPNKNIIISKIKIDFFGSMIEDKQNEN